MTYRGSTRPVPAGFKDTFLARGWKGVEKRYGASNAVIMQWIAACGGTEFLDQRRSMQVTGRKAGARGVDMEVAQ